MNMKKIVLILSVFFSFTVNLIAEERADALVLYRNGKYPEAIAICEQEIIENPQNIDSYCVLCWSLVRNRQYAEEMKQTAFMTTREEYKRLVRK